MSALMYMEENCLAVKRLAGVAPEVNCRDKAAHSGFETKRHHQQSKTGVSVAQQKGLVSSKFFFIKKDGCKNSACTSIVFMLLY